MTFPMEVCAFKKHRPRPSVTAKGHGHGPTGPPLHAHVSFHAASLGRWDGGQSVCWGACWWRWVDAEAGLGTLPGGMSSLSTLLSCGVWEGLASLGPCFLSCRCIWGCKLAVGKVIHFFQVRNVRGSTVTYPIWPEGTYKSEGKQRLFLFWKVK